MMRNNPVVSIVDKQQFELMRAQMASLIDEMADLKSQHKSLVHIVENLFAASRRAADPDAAMAAFNLSSTSTDYAEMSMDNNVASSDRSMMGDSTMDAAELSADVDAMLLDESGIDDRLLSPVIEMAGESDADLDVSMSRPIDEIDAVKADVGATATQARDDGNLLTATMESAIRPAASGSQSPPAQATEDDAALKETEEFERTENECNASHARSSVDSVVAKAEPDNGETKPIRCGMATRNNFKYSLDDDMETKFLIAMS